MELRMLQTALDSHDLLVHCTPFLQVATLCCVLRLSAFCFLLSAIGGECIMQRHHYLRSACLLNPFLWDNSDWQVTLWNTTVSIAEPLSCHQPARNMWNDVLSMWHISISLS